MNLGSTESFVSGKAGSTISTVAVRGSARPGRRTSMVRVPGASSTGRAAMAWAPAGEGKKRRARPETVPETVPDNPPATGKGTPGRVTTRASPGRARGGSTRMAVPDVGEGPVPDAVPDVGRRN